MILPASGDASTREIAEVKSIGISWDCFPNHPLDGFVL